MSAASPTPPPPRAPVRRSARRALFASALLPVSLFLAAASPAQVETSYPNLGPLLRRVAAAYESRGEAAAAGLAAAVSRQTTGAQTSADPFVPVSVHVDADAPERLGEIAAWIADRGGWLGEVLVAEPGDPFAGAVAASVPVALLAELSERPGVRYARAKPQPRTQQQPDPEAIYYPHGPADVMGATAWHHAGYTGDGIRVGVVDVGFIGFSDSVSPKLKTPAKFYCFPPFDSAAGPAPVSTTDISACERVHVHGASVSEYLLSVAPDVSLFIANLPDDGDPRSGLSEIVDWMAGNGVRIINFSVGYWWDGPGNGSSPFTNSSLGMIDRAVRNGIAFFNSAGNSNDDSWASFTPDFVDVAQSGGGTKEFLNFGSTEAPDTCLDVYFYGSALPRNRPLQLRWQGTWWQTATNLDLHLYAGSDMTGTPKLSSNDFRDGDYGGDELSFPWDILLARFGLAENLAESVLRGGQHCVAVEKVSGDDPGWLQLSSFVDADCFGNLSGGVCASSANGLANIGNPGESANAGMMAVAAYGIHGATHGLEDFSSVGPTPDLRIKPDISGVDRVSPEGLVDVSFVGTSFSSPATAGLAALVLERYAAGTTVDTPVKLVKYIRDNAIPIEYEAFKSPNFYLGHGLARLPDPDPTAAPVATLSLNPRAVLEGEKARVGVSLDKPAASDVAVTVSASPATGYALSGSSLTVPAGDVWSSTHLTITADDDQTEEADRTITLSATASGVSGILDPNDVSLTIRDDDEPPPSGPRATLRVPASITEGSIAVVDARADDSWTPEATTITVSVPASSAWSLSTNDELSNYRQAGQRKNLRQCATCFNGNSEGRVGDLVTITSTDDDVHSGGALTVVVKGTITEGGSGLTAVDDATLTIVDDEPLPVVSLSLSEDSVLEGGSATLTAELSGASSEDVTVTVSATSGDYARTGDALTISSGQTTSTGTVTFAGVDDATDDPNESITISGVAAGGNGVRDPEAVTLTFLDDEGKPAVDLLLGPPTIQEYNGASAVTAVLDRPAASDVVVTVAAADAGGATESPFTLVGDTLTIAAGATTSTGDVTVEAVDDQVDAAGDRQVLVSGTTTGTDVEAPASATLTIVDDESQVVGLALGAIYVEEGGDTTVTAGLRFESTADTVVTVKPLTDAYTVTGTGELTIAAGDRAASGTVTITAFDDDVEGPEAVFVGVSAEVTGGNGTGPPNPVILIVTDDDAVTNTAPRFTTSGPVTLSVDENAAGGTSVGAALGAEDDDNDPITWGLDDDDQLSGDHLLFEIGAGQVATRVNTALDHETKPSYRFKARVDDGRGGIARLDVTVNVNDLLEPPEAPSKPRLRSPASGSLRVEWEEPGNTGPDITGYDVRYRKSGATAWTDAGHAGTALNAEITGLEANVEYEAQVRATNDEGTSGWSASGTLTVSSGTGVWSATLTPADNTVDEDEEFIGWTDLAPGYLTQSSISVSERRANDDIKAVLAIKTLDWLVFVFEGDDHRFPGGTEVDVTVGQDTVTDKRLARVTAPGQQVPGYTIFYITTPPDLDDGDTVDLTLRNRQNTKTHWEATMVADLEAVPASKRYGYGSLGIAATIGELTDNDFDVGSTTYTVTEVMNRFEDDKLDLVVTPKASMALDGLVLDVDGTELALSGALAATQPDQDRDVYTWDYATDWTIDDPDTENIDEAVDVAMSLKQAPASNSPPVFDDGASATRTVVENTASGENVGTALTAQDADGDTLTYSLSGTDASSFSIDSTTGQLKTKAALDHETKGSYTVTVGVSDGKDANGDPDPAVDAAVDVEVTVTDVNEPPAFPGTEAGERSVAENTSSDTPFGDEFRATDSDDGDTLTYSLSGTDAGSFALESVQAGVKLKTHAALDHETKASYAVTVGVSDGRDANGDPEQTPAVDAAVNVTVRVTDVNEPPATPARPTVETASTTSLEVSWSAPVNTGPAIDDYDVRYKKSSVSDWTEWQPSAADSTDTETTITELDQDTAYDVQVRAENPESEGQWSDSGTGRTAAPDNQPPTFPSGTYEISVEENTTGEIAGARVEASDPEGAALSYSLSGAHAALFRVNSGTAQLSVPSATDLNYESRTLYSFNVVARDPAGLTASRRVEITLTDDDTEAPGTPAAPVVTTLSSSGLRVDWTAPVNAGPPISRYDVRYRAAGAGGDAPWTSHPHGDAATSTSISGLAPATSYDVQVQAVNPEGESGWSGSGTGATASSPPPGGGGPPPPPVDQQPFFLPGVSIDDLALVVGSGVRVTLPAATGGDPPLSYGVTPRPPDGIGFDPETRVLAGTPTRASAALSYTYTATDNDGDAASLNFVIQVSGGDESPSFGGASVPSQTFTVGVTARLELPAAFGGNGELHYSLSPALPSGLGFDAGSRVLWGTPVAASDPATYTYRATDSDAEGPDSDELRFTIAVATAPPPPGQSDVTASPAGEESVALILGPGWADLPRSEIDVEVRGPKHGWTPWPPPPAASRLAAGVAASEATQGTSSILIEGLDPDSPYTFRLRTETPEGEVAYSEEQSAATGWFGGPCRRGAGFLCLRDGRFEVQAHWTNPDREADFGVGTAIPLSISDESGMFWFFNPDNIELVAKVLDGRSINDHFWVFFGALSDVEYWVTVNDTSTGETRTYHNRPKEVCGQSDTSAFLRPLESSASGSAASAAASSGRGSDWARIWGREPGVLGMDLVPMNAASFAVAEPAAAAPEQGSGVCEPSAERLCLLEDRFAVAVDLIDPNVEDPAERQRAARVLPTLTTRETGFFWFFNEENVELAVKMLDGRAINGRFWLLYGGLSDVEYAINVTDTWTGLDRVYRNQAGSICGEVDTGAFQ